MCILSDKRKEEKKTNIFNEIGRKGKRLPPPHTLSKLQTVRNTSMPNINQILTDLYIISIAEHLKLTIYKLIWLIGHLLIWG